MSFPDSSL